MADDSSQEKTEEASGKKKADARMEGNVAKSTEVNSVLVLLAGIFLLRLAGPWMMRELESEIRACFALLSVTDMSVQRLLQLGQASLTLLIKIILPFAGAIMFAGVVANLMQVGFLFTTKPLMPKLSKLNPISGFGRIFAMKSVIDTIKNILKITIIGYVAYITVRDKYDEMIVLSDMSVLEIWNFLLHSTFDIFLRVALVLIIIAIFDYAYQRYENAKKLRMSHQELKEERKQLDGDPQVKGRIRQLQREMAQRRMMDNVPKASVVVTNPTHLAIALLYEPEKQDAPVVVAKGKDLVAQKIKKLAEENDVPMVENVTLARAMYDKVDVGLPIPMEFFAAVAEVMAYVYRLKNKGAA